MTDDLDDLLAPPPGSVPPAARDAILRRTERALARGRRGRRLARGAAAVAVFTAGGLAGWFAKPDRAVEVFVPSPPEVITVTVPVPVPSEAAGPVAVADPPATPGQWEVRAELADDPAEAARGYRAAGDRYLDAQDYPNAARCYRLYLDRAGAAERTPQAGDSWLLISVKNVTSREKSDATKRDG